MRTTLLALALAVAACGRADRPGPSPAANAPTVAPDRPTDQLVLRLPRTGGTARAFAYPALDSVLWRSGEPVPPISRVLAFDASAGSLAAVDARGAPIRIDLRSGTVARQSAPALSRLASNDGWALYGLTRTGGVMRLTPAGNWSFRPPAGARATFPQPDGSLIVLADRESTTVLWRLRPPETAILDSVIIPRAGSALRTQVGDRIYFTVDSGLIGVTGRDLSPVPGIRLRRPVRAMATTPSGDRIYVATDSSAELTIVDRYTDRVDTRIELPAPPVELRMDPTGRYVLARPASGDSIWVVSVGSDQLLGTTRSGWRSDLPAVAPDGRIALLRGKDVVFVDGETLAPRDSVTGGAADVWAFLTWDGFRQDAVPTPTLADARTSDTTVSEGADGDANGLAADSLRGDSAFGSATSPGGSLPGDSLPGDSTFAPPAPASRAASPAAPATPPATTPAAQAPPRRDPAGNSGTPTSARDSTRDSVRRPSQFTVQMAALRSEQAARDLARSLAARGMEPRVVATVRSGVTIYRVILGPFPTRAAAEMAVAGVSDRSYWIYEGRP